LKTLTGVGNAAKKELKLDAVSQVNDQDYTRIETTRSLIAIKSRKNPYKSRIIVNFLGGFNSQAQLSRTTPFKHATD